MEILNKIFENKGIFSKITQTFQFYGEKIGHSTQNGKTAADKKRGAVVFSTAPLRIRGKSLPKATGQFLALQPAAQAFTKPESSLFSSRKEV